MLIMEREMADTVCTRLGAVVMARHRPGAELAHVKGAFDEKWIGSLPLPTKDRAPSQTVALVDETTGSQREVDEVAVEAAYAQRPRTQILESIHSRSDGWPSLVALHLARLLRHRVLCSLFESRAGDLTLGPHVDDWDGVILQIQGAKGWRLWPEPHSPSRDVVTRAGDVLLLPRGVKHEVTTPEHSVHLLFAVTSEPFAALSA
ncbi:cupin domain-containing protein [Streptomyces sp. NBC_00838]|uniref:JmjC domain-containing protein n=1 Tax=Streptomyces sp. NBC_00838 TaxID=2903680 RepID=UPI003870664F|nr:cupin domain-containing protein [Streptomyces sp. NBC_00838]